MKPLQKVLIGGNYWSVVKLTKAQANKFIKYLKQDPEMVNLRGFCEGNTKTIYLAPGQHPEDFLNTLFHEGMHAILMESAAEFPQLMALGSDESLIHHLTAEILNFLKQTYNG